jgi:hypothetical protein
MMTIIVDDYGCFMMLRMMLMALVNKKFLLLDTILVRFPLKRFKLLSKRGLLLIIVLVLTQPKEIYTLSNSSSNNNNGISLMPTYHHVMTTTTTATLSASKSDKRKPLTKKEIVMSSSKSEDYPDEDSDEIYDDKIHLNYSGEFFNSLFTFALLILILQKKNLPCSQRNASGKSL